MLWLLSYILAFPQTHTLSLQWTLLRCVRQNLWAHLVSVTVGMISPGLKTLRQEILILEISKAQPCVPISIHSFLPFQSLLNFKKYC